MKRTWWKEAVCYQIYPRSFKDSNGDGIGDLQGIIQKLDYIKEMGIDLIWICPIYQSPNADNGYDISDYQNISDEFGTMGDFDQLLKEIHNRGMKVIMDLVINHTSDEHPWFIESKASLDNAKRDWYVWRDGIGIREPNNWESIFSGSAWQFDEGTGQYYLHLFATKQPDLNWENHEVRQALYTMVNWWLEKGIDGFRIDAISHIKKRAGLPDMPNPAKKDYVAAFDLHTNQDGIHDFLRELKTKTFDRHDIMTVGEANGVSIKQAKPWVDEDNGAFDMIFQFEHLGLWEKRKNFDEPLALVPFKNKLTEWQKGIGTGWNALFLENHDKPRSVSSLGNDREYWKESAKMLGAMYFFMKGTPFIYQGQEIGMTNVQFPTIDDYDDVGMINYYHLELAKGKSHQELMKIIWKSGRDNSRTPMQWNKSEQAGFSTVKPWMKLNSNYSRINVEDQLHDADSIYSFYKNMIKLRKENEVLIYGEYELHMPDDPDVFVYSRHLDDSCALILSNFRDVPKEISLPSLKKHKLAFALGNYLVEEPLNVFSITLQPYETRLYLS